MNQPSRGSEGVRKLTFTRDTKVSNAGTFIVQKENAGRARARVFAAKCRTPPITASSLRCAPVRRDAR